MTPDYQQITASYDITPPLCPGFEGQIIITDNEKGRGMKAGTKSQCDPLDFPIGSLDREEEYLVRIPKDIKSKIKCN